MSSWCAEDRSASPIALEAIRLQASSLRASVCGLHDVDARANNLLASSMANIACGNARLALQLLSLRASESMGNHDSNVVGAGRVG
jgi:hypothetical protein